MSLKQTLSGPGDVLLLEVQLYFEYFEVILFIVAKFMRLSTIMEEGRSSK